ncbi:MAG: sortase [bacterium]|nr:sortase [bacterium]
MSTRPQYQVHERPPKRVFFAAVVMVFFCAVSVADSIGFVPYYIDGSPPAGGSLTTSGTEPVSAYGGVRTETLALSDLPELGEEIVTSKTATPVETTLPERIKISAIDLDLPVQNIESRDLSVLDEYLKKGPIRYVDSARLGEEGNVLIFGHSSHLPVVKNQMYKAFNRAPELSVGDTITLEGKGKNYLYSVTSVRSVDVGDTTIDLSPTQGTKLTLVTCDTLTGKSARFIVEADFIGSL